MASTIPPPPKGSYGFIGIGNMGYGMAMCLAKALPADSELTVLDLNTAAVEKFLAEAAESAPSIKVSTAANPLEVATRASTVITSLPHDDAVKTVFTHPTTGLLALPSDCPSKLIIETSTIHTTTLLPIAEPLTASHPNITLLSAPVSGGIPAAHAGTLTTMCGGSQDAFEAAKPVMHTWCQDPEKIFLCGGITAGLATKQINNYVAMVSYIGLCEGMNAGLLASLDPHTLASIINVSSGMSWNSLHMNPVPGVNPKSSASNNFEPGFPTELALGVMRQATGLMESVGAKGILNGKVVGLFETAVEDERCKGRECRSVWRLFSEDGGRGLGPLVDGGGEGRG